ncbi:hypothetical protein A3C73_04870 [Candidatus Giovannonibacteria bacterium RIFCSPHIGHO2_02_FULL_44_11]|nr:MAG: hypothetical protein A3C73_04870 [Candidatus Giovannonibacteria bacterium RIFCSPHIGHO2_02_FULL_44_11]
MAAILNELQRNGISHANIKYLCFLLSLFIVRWFVAWIFHGPARMMENKNAFLVRANYKKYLLGGIMFLPLEWHTDHHSGDTIDKVEKGSRGLYNYASESFRVINLMVYLAGAIITLAFFDIGASVITFVMMILTLTLIMKFDKILVAQYRQLNRFENGISEKIVDVVTNITTVVILRIEKLLVKSISGKMMEPLDLFLRNNRLNEIKWCLVSLNTKIMLVLVLGYYFYARLYWGLPWLAGTFIALYTYTDNIAETFFNFAGIYGNILQQRASVSNSEELASGFNGIVNGNNDNGGKHWGKIEINSLNFSYRTDENADLHLDDISLSIKRGEKIALIGATGSGKTTLLKVIRELYKPQTASVFADGKKLTGGFGAISSEITLIPQEPEIFATTILENITLGVDHEMQEVRKFTDMARFTEVADNLPREFNSSIKEKGVNLSGGEKQRLALARGLLACADKSIVLLDEPTSSIDVATELSIYQNIFQDFCDKSIVASVHRLHLLPMFDNIYFFSEGKILASGSFGELLESSAEFKELWNKYQNMVQDLQDRA